MKLLAELGPYTTSSSIEASAEMETSQCDLHYGMCEAAKGLLRRLFAYLNFNNN